MTYEAQKLAEIRTVVVSTIAEELAINSQDIRLSQNYFEIGGYSIAALKIITKLNKLLHGKMDLLVFMNCDSLSDIVNYFLYVENGRRH